MTWLLWAIATSDLTLMALGLVLVAALVIGFAPLLDRFPVIGAYVPLARLVALLLLFVIGLCVGHRLADESAALAQARTDLAFKDLELDAQKRSADVAAKLRADAEAKAGEADKKVSDYEAELAKRPENDACALDGGDVDRLRGIAK
ncbi:hypothetical protein IVB18_26130 [Bradyrhizobium sp. 186]|uniref:hypothetical protein n=1 Tax=Bradyrhizobium sp. 186 TaxID=2782654 RepID=UPI002001BFF6|nr:hypothetical protein [Bradyrhizobium sp. 186]UPK31811.1 hypothetical protein IVB18_26130 [Bradyrhizobium sp. 186]